jgi:thioredoxin-dependent peroxiredoxin
MRRFSPDRSPQIHDACDGEVAMKRVLLGLALSSLVALPAFAALKEGDAAPQFTTQASLKGKEFTFSLAKALKKGPVVVYFYPSAYTGGCNIQAHTFAENADKFAAAHATIIGVSLDSIKRLNDFSADPQYCAGKFPTASDATGSIAKSYDLKVFDGKPGMKDTRGVDIDHGFTERTTFIITPDGKINKTVGGMGVAPDKNVEQALAAVQELAASKGKKS